MDHDPGPRGPDLLARRLVHVVSAIIVATHALGLAFSNGRLWGVDLYRFYPPACFILGTIAVLVLAMAALRPGGAMPAPAPDPARARALARAMHALIPLGLALVATALFWLLRARNIFLGDGIALVSSLPVERSFHPLEPLSQWLQQTAYAALAPRLAAGGGEPYRVAWTSAAITSVAAGAVFVPFAWQLARRLCGPTPDAEPAAHGSAWQVTALVFLVLIAQGYSQLFFGYVENYAFSLAAIAAYLLASLRVIEERAALWPAAAAFGIAVGLHLASLTLLPSFAVVVAIAWAGRRERPRLSRDLTLAALWLAAPAAVLALLGGGYNLVRTAFDVVRTIFMRQPDSFPHYFLSLRHLRDFTNEQLLIGPLGLLLFAPLAIAAFAARARPARQSLFLVTLGASFVLVAVLAGDSNLGYARNWDLLAPGGFALTAAGLALLLRRMRDRFETRAALVLLAAVSCFHTIPWVGINASESRALARFGALPLDLGRVESTLGFWYELRGDDRRAETWLVRSLEKNPDNVRAHVFLGGLYDQRGWYRLASVAYRNATRLRPARDDYRLRLVDALVMDGRPAEAVPEVERVLQHQPRDPRVWSVYGIVLLGVGRPDAARDAFASARRVAPETWVYRTMSNYVDVSDGYRKALGDVWKALISA